MIHTQSKTDNRQFADNIASTLNHTQNRGQSRKRKLHFLHTSHRNSPLRCRIETTAQLSRCYQAVTP